MSYQAGDNEWPFRAPGLVFPLERFPESVFCLIPHKRLPYHFLGGTLRVVLVTWRLMEQRVDMGFGADAEDVYLPSCSAGLSVLRDLMRF